MYKLTRHVPATTRRFVLIRQRGEGPCSLVLMCGERRYSSKPPPRKSHKLLWTVTGASLLTGATVVYAKNSPDFREWLSTNAPWADNLVAVVFQEHGTIDEWAMSKYNSVSRSISESLFGVEGKIVEKKTDATAPPAKYEEKDYNLPQSVLAPKIEEEPTVEKPEVPPAKVIMADPVEQKKVRKIPIKKDIVLLESVVRDSVKTAIDNYSTAADACAKYTKHLFKIVESSVEELDMSKFDSIRIAQKEQVKAAKIAEKADKAAEDSIKELSSRLNEGDAAPIEAAHAAQRHLAQYKADLASARDNFKKQEEHACLYEKYWSKVEAARKSYLSELEAMFPGVDISACKLSLESGNPDMLLVHTVRQIAYLQNLLAETNTIHENKLKRAIQSHDQKDLIEAKVDEIVKKEKAELHNEYLKKSMEQSAEAERKTREELKKQIELHQEHLRDKLAAKEAEVQKRFDAMASEAVEKEKLKFATELAQLRAKLKAIEENLKARTRAENQSRRAQSLWAAGESLLATTKARAPVDKAIKAIEKAGGDDELVKTVVKGISQDVRENGLLTENELREKYIQMEKTALQVALVGKDGAPLPVYLLSYIQSLLLFSRVSAIPQSELNNEPTDFSSMDAYDVLQRARYWMERNDIAATLRYVNLLTGASRTVAAGWREAAIKHLEIKQAAETVMAHASASAIQNS